MLLLIIYTFNMIYAIFVFYVYVSFLRKLPAGRDGIVSFYVYDVGWVG